jgi:ACS family pantothenate transporter-like MFS transporter
MAGWYLNYIGAVSLMLLCSWASSQLQHEPQVHTVLFASGTVLAYILNASLPLVAYPAREAPYWRVGAKVYLGFACFSVPVFLGIWWRFRWEEKRKVAGGSGGTVVGVGEDEKYGTNKSTAIGECSK